MRLEKETTTVDYILRRNREDRVNIRSEATKYASYYVCSMRDIVWSKTPVR